MGVPYGLRSLTNQNITLFVWFFNLMFSSIHILPRMYTDLTQNRLPTRWVIPLPRVTSDMHITFPVCDTSCRCSNDWTLQGPSHPLGTSGVRIIRYILGFLYMGLFTHSVALLNVGPLPRRVEYFAFRLTFEVPASNRHGASLLGILS
ncbi:AC5 protein [Chenopodium leaf curl virus]|uniref:AC5 protein n=1 Tax=Chenopodium leaf curl virus TaxID=1032478 RepID=F6KBA1_9GEMI|nr:AC5 protein [Chenopodium leaf curl virus]AEF12619.1 AC5 protein [Chenopodium leaf curl virus]